MCMFLFSYSDQQICGFQQGKNTSVCMKLAPSAEINTGWSLKIGRFICCLFSSYLNLVTSNHLANYFFIKGQCDRCLANRFIIVVGHYFLDHRQNKSRACFCAGTAPGKAWPNCDFMTTCHLKTDCVWHKIEMAGEMYNSGQKRQWKPTIIPYIQP